MFFSCYTRQLRDVMFDLIRNHNIVDSFFNRCQFTMRDNAFYFCQIFFFHSIKYFLFICETWIRHQHFKQKSINLSFGEGICSFLFYRILCSQNKEWVREFMRYSSDSYLMFLHGFKEC